MGPGPNVSVHQIGHDESAAPKMVKKASAKPQVFAEWNYKIRQAELTSDGQTILSTSLMPANPSQKGDSRVLATFPGDRIVEVAACWWCMVHPTELKPLTPVCRPTKQDKKTAQKKKKAPTSTKHI